ncbi:hypothetical protein ACSSS7_004077 [Eimeria intestinalis]
MQFKGSTCPLPSTHQPSNDPLPYEYSPVAIGQELVKKEVALPSTATMESGHIFVYAAVARGKCVVAEYVARHTPEDVPRAANSSESSTYFFVFRLKKSLQTYPTLSWPLSMVCTGVYCRRMR